jgi:hypothetical protein
MHVAGAEEIGPQLQERDRRLHRVRVAREQAIERAFVSARKRERIVTDLERGAGVLPRLAMGWALAARRKSLMDARMQGSQSRGVPMNLLAKIEVHVGVTAAQAIMKTLGRRHRSMATLVFGLNQSLDGYVDHWEFAPGPALFRHFIEPVHGLSGSVYGRRMWK